MKRILLKYNLLILMLLVVQLLIAGDLEEKKKTINKSFKISSSTELKVSNEFGEVEINSWEKQELKVDIEIIVNGRNESRAYDLLDRIEIDIRESSGEVSFETEFDGGMNTRGDESFKVNYKISLPASNQITVKNKFGDTYIDHRSGKSFIDVSYGSLKTEDFEGYLELELSFGKGYLGRTKKSEIEVKYSDLEMDNADEMEMEQQFSDVSLENVNTLKLESKYGKMEIGEAGKVDCDVQFSGFDIERINESLYMEANYVSDFELQSLNKDFSFVKFYGKFSTFELNIEDGTKADLEAEFSFARMNSSLDMDVYYKVKEDNRSEYKARIGGGDPNKKIVVKSSYGDFRIR